MLPSSPLAPRPSPLAPRPLQDTAGQERFDSLSSFYCRGARAAIICFDLTDRASFESLSTKWIKKVNRRTTGPPDPPGHLPRRTTGPICPESEPGL